MKIHVLHCGYIRIPESLRNSSGNIAGDIRKATFARKSELVTMPTNAYLIEHPKGLFLVDTGWSREISPNGEYDKQAVEKILPRHLATLYKPFVPERMTVHEQLESRGIRPEDLEMVLITHFDADHVSGLKSVMDAKRIIIPEEESYWSSRTKYALRQVRKLWDIEKAEHLFYRGYPLGPVNRAIDITGDESIMMVSLPGHTNGHAGIIVRDGEKYVVIAGDAAFSPHNWEMLTPPGFSADAGLQIKTLNWLADVAADPNCVSVLCSHDTAENDVITVKGQSKDVVNGKRLK